MTSDSPEVQEFPFKIDDVATPEQRYILEEFGHDVLANRQLVRDCLEIYFVQGNVRNLDASPFERVDALIEFAAEKPGSLAIFNRLRIILGNRLDWDLINFGETREKEIDQHPRVAKLIDAFRANPTSEGFRTQRRRFRLLGGLGLVSSLDEDDVSSFPVLPADAE